MSFGHSDFVSHSSFVIRHFTLNAILVSSAFQLTSGPPLAAQVQPPPEILLSEVRIAGAEEWVEVVSNSASGVDLARYSIELRDFGGNLRPDSLFPLIDNREGRKVLGPGEYLTVSCDPDGDGGTVSLIREPGDGIPRRRVVDVFNYDSLPALQGLSAYGRDLETGQWCAEDRWTRGEANLPCAERVRPQVVLNEVNTNSGLKPGCPNLVECPFQVDWAELRWTGKSERVDLSDYVLENRGFTFEFPSPTILDAEHPHFVVLFAGPDGLEPLGVPPPPRSIVALEFLSRDGDSLLLYREVAELPDGFPSFDWDAVRIPVLLEGELYARQRTPDGPGGWDFTDVPTLGSDNVIEFDGRKPWAEVIDRFPFRVHPGDDVEVYVEVVDRDGDVKKVTLDWRLTPAGGADPISDSSEMWVDKRVYCERDVDELIYRGLIPGDRISGLAEITYSVTVEDERGNIVVTEPHKVHVQAVDWEDGGQFTHRIRINEISANTNPDDQGPKFDPNCHDCLGDWVELYNPLSSAVDLSGAHLTQNILNLDFRKLPSGTAIGPFGFLLVCFDALPGGGIHIPYRLDRCRDEVILIHQDGKHVIDSIRFQEEKPDRTFGRVPDGGDKLGLLFPTPCRKNSAEYTVRFTTADSTPLVINEVSADNKTIRSDRGGEFGDYIEIYNRSGLPKSLDGWKLMDRGIERDLEECPRNPQDCPWEFPPGVTVLQGQRLIVWCDNDTEEILEPADGEWGSGLDPVADGELHSHFELNRRRDFVVLLDENGDVADRVDFTDQLRDIPVGRTLDGGPNSGLVKPSPGEANEPDFIDGDSFRRGDLDGNSALEVTDPILLLRHLFLGDKRPDCLDAADVDDSGVLDISDPIYSLTFQFVGGPPPPLPGPMDCGPDPTDDGLLPCAYPQALCEP